MADGRPGFTEAALNAAGLVSGKALLHTLSFGRVRVAIPPLLPDGRSPLVTILPDKRLAVHPTLAEALGVLFWLAAFLAAFAIYQDHAM